ncbi:hypothetical protein PENSUB_4532 [Penicillium subrubescens]|uniref:Uncharacterized protein n=2 Tax=Penicillium subrubescens TaxID=1316194 RepID=A0A1Q5UC65_9EURO|nr:hypothetical protein PENSUB_4532 [Penicillium subrubescens]
MESPSTSNDVPSAASESGYEGDNEASDGEGNTEDDENLKLAKHDADDTSADIVSTDEPTSVPPHLQCHKERNIPAKPGALDCPPSPDSASEIDIIHILLDICEPPEFY